MSYSQSIDSGITWMALRQPASVPRTATGSDNTARWLAEGWHEDSIEAYPVGTNPVLKAGPDYSGEPTAGGTEAVWQAKVLEGQAAREALKSSIDSQVPIVTVTDEARDSTARAKAEQMEGKRKAALVALDATDDVDLPTYDSTLTNYDSSEQDYAASMVKQELRNLLADGELKDAGLVGPYTTAEVTEITDRITHNDQVQQGLATVAQTPSKGAPRSDTALENELVEKAYFTEITFDWNSTPYYMPEIILPGIPAEQDSAQVYGMLYTESGTYLTWVPFTQQSDGTWKSATGVSHISAAKIISSKWRVAVAANGTQAQFEVTDRVLLNPPNVSDSNVRFGGRG